MPAGGVEDECLAGGLGQALFALGLRSGVNPLFIDFSAVMSDIFTL
jgi:hypothetical protein